MDRAACPVLAHETKQTKLKTFLILLVHVCCKKSGKIYQRCKKEVVLVSSGCHNKIPQTGVA